MAVLSGFLLTGSFPKNGISWLAWIALVPLLISLRNLTFSKSFLLGLLTGSVHYLTLVYWIAYTVKIYGRLPLVVCVGTLLLLSVYLAFYAASFSAILSRFCPKPATCFFMAPVLWVFLEYLRSFLFTGFPWGLIGYSQANNLHLIQISDMLGIYGISFLIVLSNAAFFLIFLYSTQKSWKGTKVTKRLAAGSVFIFALLFGLAFFYGTWRIQSMDELVSDSSSASITIVQGNIDQAEKWDPEFQLSTVKKYINLSLSVKEQAPDLVVWPETSTPFYFLHNENLSKLVKKGISDTGADFLIGSPSFVQRGSGFEYYNSAYLIGSNGEVDGKYDKTHLVPFGEYVPFSNCLFFIEKIVRSVGDFKPGNQGDTIEWRKHRLGLQICYEIIFPNLSRTMVKNGSNLLVNITNDAWFGKTSAPYQHFSMAVFRAVENRRSLIRSANTGISGFVDPAGRIVASTPLFQEATMTRDMPLIYRTTFYTRFGDLFAVACLVASLFLILLKLLSKQ